MFIDFSWKLASVESLAITIRLKTFPYFSFPSIYEWKWLRNDKNLHVGMNICWHGCNQNNRIRFRYVSSLADKITSWIAKLRLIYFLFALLADDPNNVWYIICGVIIAMLSVGIIIILVAVTIRWVQSFLPVSSHFSPWTSHRHSLVREATKIWEFFSCFNSRRSWREWGVGFDRGKVHDATLTENKWNTIPLTTD